MASRFPEPWGLEDEPGVPSGGPGEVPDASPPGDAPGGPGEMPDQARALPSGEVPDRSGVLPDAPPGGPRAQAPPHLLSGGPPQANVDSGSPPVPVRATVRAVRGRRDDGDGGHGFGGDDDHLPVPAQAELDAMPAAGLVDRAAADGLMERWGFLGVDAVDAEDYRLLREAKVRTLRRLNEVLRDRNVRIGPEKLAQMAQRLQDSERGKVAVAASKAGKLSERTRGGTTFKARIGVAARTPDGAEAAFRFELETTER